MKIRNKFLELSSTAWWCPFVLGSPTTHSICYDNGRNSIDWPLREKEGKVISFMTDWMFYQFKTEWQSLALAVMSLATHHVFVTQTENWRNLLAMLDTLDRMSIPSIYVPADMSFMRAIQRANRNAGKFNLSRRFNIVADPNLAKKPPAKIDVMERIAALPWPPKNIFFGFRVNDVQEAQTMAAILPNVRGRWPSMRLMIHQYTNGAPIDWEKLGMPGGTVDIIYMPSDSISKESAKLLMDYRAKTATRVYINETTDVVPFETPQDTIDLRGVLV